MKNIELQKFNSWKTQVREHHYQILLESVVEWNQDRLIFLLEKCNIKHSDLVRHLKLEDKLNTPKLKTFIEDGTLEDDDLLWELHFSINKFFKP